MTDVLLHRFVLGDRFFFDFFLTHGHVQYKENWFRIICLIAAKRTILAIRYTHFIQQNTSGIYIMEYLPLK